MKKKIFILMVLSTVILLTFTGCVPGDGTATSIKPAGFFWGIWHGWIAPISLIMGLLGKNVRVYETFNSGWWYDFGYYMAIISGFGGLSLFRKEHAKRNGK